MKTKLRHDEIKMLKIAGICGAALIITLLLAVCAFALAGDTSPPTPNTSPISVNIDGGTYQINMSKTTPTPTPTPRPEPVAASGTKENETGDYPDAHGAYLYDFSNNTYALVNVTGTPTPIPSNIAEARRLGWTPDLGDVDEYINKINLAYGYIKPAPQLSLEILNDQKVAWNWQQEVLTPGQIVSGYYRINNLADTAYQGDIDVYINASLYYQNGLVHMENKILSEFVSINPRYYNEHWISWMVPKEISTGVYEIRIELREQEHGKTIASYRMTPTVAYVDGSGYKYF